MIVVLVINLEQIKNMRMKILKMLRTAAWTQNVLILKDFQLQFVLNLFLVYNQKYNYASSVNKLDEICACAAVICKQAWSEMHLANCAALAAALFTTLIANILF